MSAMAEHWERTLKERLVAYTMTRGFSDGYAKEIARYDLGMLADLLEHTRREAWQDGHDTALINGQSENPYDQEPR